MILPPTRPEKMGLLRDAEDAEKETFMENRYLPIFHKFSGFQPLISLKGGEKFFVCRYLPTNKKFFSLRSLCLCGESKPFYILLNNF